MKSFSDFLQEKNIKAEQIPVDAEAAAKRIDKELKSILGPKFIVQVKFSTNLGKSIHLRVYDSKPAYNIPHNSPAFMQLMMYLSSNFGRDEDRASVSWESSTGNRQQKEAGINFRKISSKKSIDDATDKLLKWFKKNRDNFHSLLK